MVRVAVVLRRVHQRRSAAAPSLHQRVGEVGLEWQRRRRRLVRGGVAVWPRGGEAVVVVLAAWWCWLWCCCCWSPRRSFFCWI